MNDRQRHIVYPPYQYQPFSAPHSMHHRGFDYAATPSRTNKQMNQPKFEETNVQKPVPTKKRSEKKTVKKNSSPILFAPPIVNDHEIQSTLLKRKGPRHEDDQKDKNHDSPASQRNEVKDDISDKEDEQDTQSKETTAKKGSDHHNHTEASRLNEHEKDSSFNLVNDKNNEDSSHDLNEKDVNSIANKPAHNRKCKRKMIALLEESSSFEELSSFAESSSFEELSSFAESSSFEELSSFTESSSFKEFSSFAESSSLEGDCLEPILEKNTLPTVKLPVLLAILEVNIDVFDQFDLPLPIANISKIDWSLQSLDCQVLLPSPNVFIKGRLIADIEYSETKENKTYSIHTTTVTIPFEKVLVADWLKTPEQSYNHQTEYMYQDKNQLNVQYHREFTETLAKPIESDLKNIYFIWHNELVSKNRTEEVGIQGSVTLSIHLLQSQYVDLNDY